MQGFDSAKKYNIPKEKLKISTEETGYIQHGGFVKHTV